MKVPTYLASFESTTKKIPLSNSTSIESLEDEENPPHPSTSNNKQSRMKSATSESFDMSPVRFGKNYNRNAGMDSPSPTTRLSLSTVLIFIILSVVFLILPIIYLLNCFDFIYEQQNLRQNSIFANNIDIINENGEININPIPKRIDTPNDQDLKNNLQLHKSGKNLLPDPPKPDPAQCSLVKEEDKLDCFPDPNPTQETCESRGCCWGRTIKDKNADFKLKMGIPSCFYPANYNTYKYVNITETAFGLVAYLKCTYNSPYPDTVENLQMTIKYETEDRLHVKFTDADNNRYESAYPEVPIVDTAASNRNYIFEIGNSSTSNLGFKVKRKSDNVTLFDSYNYQNFIFADQFLQLGTRLPSKYIYGLGDHTERLLLNVDWFKKTMWNHDKIPVADSNLYGAHPFYLVLEETGRSHGVFLLNSNAMEVVLQPTPAVTFRTLGGVLDFYFFMGPTPADVVAQYTDLIGRPFMPPYWGLGFHLCRFGYKTLNDTIAVMERNLDAGIAIETQWNDLDYMDRNNDFSYNKENYEGLPEFLEQLHNNKMHYIPIVDCGISAGEEPNTYPPYDKGIEMDIFVKNSSGLPFIGKVWNPVATVWPDFTNPDSYDYWKLMLQNFYNEVPIDGVWIDMNEPSNFWDGQADGCPDSKYETPPYLPDQIDNHKLCYKTLCSTAQQKGGLHYNVHNLYGFTEAIVTSLAISEIRGKRPFVISRSTFSGLGHYTGHWTGDVQSTWTAMEQSVPHILSFGLFGIPLIGADICGFDDNSTEMLCNRWQQLGAFYPFSRNHNSDSNIPQDPAVWGDLVISSTIRAYTVRYELLPYLYTLFYKAHVNGETVARPVFFEFIQDTATYDLDSEFLWGPALLIIPVLEENKTEVTAYFPQGNWYDYYTNEVLKSEGGNVNLDAPLDTIPVFVRGGYILPQQEAKKTTAECRETKIKLLIALDDNGEAAGDLFWDDGDTLNTIEENAYSLINFKVTDSTLTSETIKWAEEYPPNIDTLKVLGVSSLPPDVFVNNVSVSFQYNETINYLLVENLDIPLEKLITVTW